MKHFFTYKVVSGVFLIFSLFSCDSFLDTLPDNRLQIDNEKKIAQLLVSAYPKANYSVVAELSSDNFVDNNSILPVNLSSFERMHDEIFSWNAVTSSTEEDSPSYIWESCYMAIASANHALQSIESLKTTNPRLDLNAQKGEALLCRAYSHFILVNIFCQTYKDETASALDIGIPYALTPETIVNGNYQRETVTSVYSKIQQDIEEAYNLISDQNYSVPKYHFNKKAAAAFATRFFLYKRNYEKVLFYSSEVLTNSPSSLMRNLNLNYDNIMAISNDYINSQLPCNLLLLSTNSVFNRIFGTRYGHNGTAMYGSIFGAGPTWSGYLPCFTGKLYIAGEQDYGVFFPKSYEMFEYTDKIAGIGFPHVVRAEFTVEETLLCRAEALIFLNRIPEAVDYLQLWNLSHLAPKTLSEQLIKSFYVSNNTLFVKTLNSEKISSSFVVSATQRPFVNCVLHFRRIETIFDGYRWFDIKRYGIEIEHNTSASSTNKLLYNDPRRAIQIPQEVISAGIAPNPGIKSSVSSGNFKRIN